MRDDAAAYIDANITRNVLVELWDTATPSEILDGTAVGEFDISPFCKTIKQTESKLTVELRYNTAFLNCDIQPKPGEVITVKTDGTMRFSGAIEAIDTYTEERGTRMMSITARLRDGFGGWRTAHATSSVYPQGTSYVSILDDICGRVMSLEENEYTFPAISYTVPHTNSQFSDETPWDMVTNILFASNMEPHVDVLNRITANEKSVVRAPTLTMPNDRIVRIHGSRQTQSTSKVRLRWLSPAMEKTTQQDQHLYETSITAGFFDLKQEEEAWFSDDHTQRAEGTYLVIKQSVNAGLVFVADEDYKQKNLYKGEITLSNPGYVATLAGAGLALIISSSFIGDGVVGSVTTTVGRVIEAAGTVAVLTAMMSMGVGRYQIRGVPYDFVNAKNTTIAYADNIKEWAASEEEIDNDLIINEGHAQLISTEQLLWKGAQAFAFGATIVDDPRIEKGDIIEFEDGSRLLVQTFSNDYSRGALATMQINGFRV